MDEMAIGLGEARRKIRLAIEQAKAELEAPVFTQDDFKELHRLIHVAMQNDSVNQHTRKEMK